jgi:hypothetical protein
VPAIFATLLGLEDSSVGAGRAEQLKLEVQIILARPEGAIQIAVLHTEAENGRSHQSQVVHRLDVSLAGAVARRKSGQSCDQANGQDCD